MSYSLSEHTVKAFRSESGQSLVELAIALPLLLLVILALVDFAGALNYWLDASHVASQGARLAVVNGSQRDCSTLASLIQQQTYGQLKTGTLAGSGVQSPAIVSISFPANTGPENTPQIGDPVTVTVTASYKYFPSGYIPGSAPIAASATMRLEQTPGFTSGCST